MEERIGGLGGRFELQSAPGEGTRIELRLPAKAAKEVTAHELVAA
jgi:signal transduction histidine kinase